MQVGNRGNIAKTSDGDASSWPLRVSRTMSRLATAYRDLLFVPRCAFCWKNLSQGRLCRVCERVLTAEDSRTCARCALPLPDRSQRCVHCRVAGHWSFDQVVSLGSYEGERRLAAIRMKRVTEQPLICAVAEMLSTRIRESVNQPQLVTCVPSHWFRRWSRGFWPASILGETVAKRLGTAWNPSLIRMVRPTKKQGTRLPNQRRTNVRGAFRARRGIDLLNQHVLLVDDVMTTGATVNEVCRTLRNCGAGRITVAVFARATGK